MEAIHMIETIGGREVPCVRYIGHGLHEDGTFVEGDELFLMDYGKDGVTRCVIHYPEDRSPEHQARVMAQVQRAAWACLQRPAITKEESA